MGTLAVVSIFELGQALPGVSRIVVQTPVDLFGLERPIKPFQQTQLRRCAVLNPNVGEEAVDIVPEALGDT